MYIIYAIYTDQSIVTGVEYPKTGVAIITALKITYVSAGLSPEHKE